MVPDVKVLDSHKVSVYSVGMANNKATHYNIMYNFRINPELFHRIDALRKVLADRDGLPYERSAVVRMLLARALKEMEKELGII